MLVYGDGARHANERSDVEATRAVARELLGDRAEYYFSDSNQGLSRSVIRGVGEVLERFGNAIVVEDDLDLAPEFISYMNSALERYADTPEVYQVSGYQFSVPEFALRQHALFLPIAVSWGWATWKRAWKSFDSDAVGWEHLLRDRVLRYEFNLGGVYGYATMLLRQMTGMRDSWAIRWYWAVFREKGVVLFPPVSLVRNTGFDGTGTHGRGVLRNFNSPQQNGKAVNILMPDDVRIHAEDFAVVRRALWQMNGRWFGAVVDRLRWYITVLRASKWV